MVFTDQRTMSGRDEISVTSKIWVGNSDLSQLVISNWNNQLSLRFNPFKGMTAEGFREYSRDRGDGVITALQPDNVKTFLTAIYDKFLPALKNGENVSVSVLTGTGLNAKIIELKFADGELTLNVYINVDPETNIGKHAVGFKFGNRTYIENYDAESGSGEQVIVQSELLMFIDALESVKLSTASIAHGIKYAEEARSVFVAGKSGFTGTYSNNFGNNYDNKYSNSSGGYTNANQNPLSGTTENNGLDFL